MQIGCCLITILCFIGARTVLFFAWIFSNWYNAFETWYFALLCWLVVPFTSMVYIHAHFHNNGEINGWYWFWIVLAIMSDLSSDSSSSSSSKKGN